MRPLTHSIVCQKETVNREGVGVRKQSFERRHANIIFIVGVLLPAA